MPLHLQVKQAFVKVSSSALISPLVVWEIVILNKEFFVKMANILFPCTYGVTIDPLLAYFRTTRVPVTGMY